MPLCHHSDSALHILSGCQHQIISGMLTERRNIASRLIMKAIEAGSLEGCLVQMDMGSKDQVTKPINPCIIYQLAEQNRPRMALPSPVSF